MDSNDDRLLVDSIDQEEVKFSSVEEDKNYWFELGKKTGREEVQNEIKESLGLS